VARSSAVVVTDIDIGSALQEGPHNLDPGVLSCQVQRRLTLVVDGVDLGAWLGQHPGHFGGAVACGQMQWGCAK
jgi:hypothetical protein